MQFEVPDSKIAKFLEVLESVKSQAILLVRLLARLLGLLNLFSRALGQIVRLMTKSLYSCLHPAYFSEKRWGNFTSLSDSAKESYNFGSYTL